MAALSLVPVRPSALGLKKMVNGSRFCRALESVSIAPALASALYLPMPDPSPSNADSLKLQLLTARKEYIKASLFTARLRDACVEASRLFAKGNGQFVPLIEFSIESLTSLPLQTPF